MFSLPVAFFHKLSNDQHVWDLVDEVIVRQQLPRLQLQRGHKSAGRAQLHPHQTGAREQG